jgi:hypothetical protein
MIIVSGSPFEKGDLIVIGTDSKLFFIAQDPFKPTIDGWLFFGV